jgi:hypothetical protein
MSQGASVPNPTAFVRRGDQVRFTEAALVGYAGEAQLQEILADHPTLLPGVDGPAIACREFQSGSGPADVVVLDGAGSLTVTECKLAQNSEVRREVVGQVVDYASRMWRMSMPEFERRWISRTGASPFEFFGDGAASVREGLAASLETGRFSVVLAVDGINDDLRRMVEYLNAITLPEIQVLAFEIARVRHGDVEILLPRVFGAELATAKKTASQPSWTEQAFLEELDAKSPAAAAAVRELLAEIHDRGLPVTNGTATEPSLIVGSVAAGATVWSLSLFSGGSNALSALFRLERFVDRGINAVLAADLLCQIPGVTPDLDSLRNDKFRRWVKVPMTALSAAESRRLLIEALSATGSVSAAPAPA